MNLLSLRRRLGIAVVSLAIAAALFRGQLAAALVTRGDDALRNGDGTAAVRYYFRALTVDPGESRAADRLAFYLGMRHGAGDAQTAIAVATRALTILPGDPALLADRGLAEQRLRDWSAAERDFGLAGALGHDARYDHLAGRVALRLGDIEAARHFFGLALVHDPDFHPARVALARLP